MWDDAVTRRALQLLAQLLDYPEPGIVSAAEECATLLGIHDVEAAAVVRRFGEQAALMQTGELQETYTAAFDLDPARALYVGYHLFGETYKRSIFLFALKEHYRQCGFDAGAELPDHLVVLLRFLARCPDPRRIGETVEEGLLPALDNLLGEFDERGLESETPSSKVGQRVYLFLLAALRRILKSWSGTHDHKVSREEWAHV